MHPLTNRKQVTPPHPVIAPQTGVLVYKLPNLFLNSSTWFSFKFDPLLVQYRESFNLGNLICRWEKMKTIYRQLMDCKPIWGWILRQGFDQLCVQCYGRCVQCYGRWGGEALRYIGVKEEKDKSLRKGVYLFVCLFFFLFCFVLFFQWIM